MFPLQVKDYAENTYYSNFISHLEDIRYAGKRNQQKVHQGRGMSLSVMETGGMEESRVGRVADKLSRGHLASCARSLSPAVPVAGSRCTHLWETRS